MLSPISSILPLRTETVVASAGGTVFAVTTVALVILVGLQVNLGMGGFFSIHGTGMVGFVVFAVAFHLRQRKLNDEIEASKHEIPSGAVDSSSHISVEIVQHPSEAEQIPDRSSGNRSSDSSDESSESDDNYSSEGTPEHHFLDDERLLARRQSERPSSAATIPGNTPPTTSLAEPLAPLTLNEFTALLTNNLTKLQTSLTNMLVAFAGAYERSCGNKLNPEKIRDSLNTLFTTCIQIINDKKQLARTAFVLTAKEYLTAESLVSGNDQHCLAQLATALKVQDSNDPVSTAFSTLMEVFSEKIKLDSDIKSALGNLRKLVLDVKNKNIEFTKTHFDIKQKALKALQEAETAQEQAFSELLEMLYIKANLPETETQAFLELLFTSYIATLLQENRSYVGLTEQIKKMLAVLKDEYTTTFNDSLIQKAVWTGSTAVARQVWYYYINSGLFSVGLSESYKDALKCRYGVFSGPIDTLLSELVGPSYHGTFNQDHRFRKGLEALLNSEIEVPEMKEDSLEETIRVSLAFMDTVTQKLNGMRFA